MMREVGADKRFLMLQGPHGPFFHALAAMLRKTGAQVWRVGFNFGDRVFWPESASFIAFRAPQADWPDTFAALIAAKGITDIVLYGDTRPLHAQAISIAKDAGLRVHVFEEGYLRPYWVTYERGGSNGNSMLMDKTVAQMRADLAQSEMDQPEAPTHWGDMRQHMFWGALYHGLVAVGFGGFRHYQPHRNITVGQEFRLYCRKLLLMPLHRWERMITSYRIRQGGFPYHLVLLQLDHDSNFRRHSPFASMAEFLALVIEGFAKGAAPHHHLVFKAHPLEDGRAPLCREIRRLVQAHGLTGRVHFVRGGKLAAILNHARSAVTVNSTAAQQVLWRGLPLKLFGAAVYAKPEFVSMQPLEEFFANPTRPNRRAYREYRQYLLDTSQLPGGYYSSRGRRALLRQVVDMMLIDQDPYEALTLGSAAPRQQLRLVN